MTSLLPDTSVLVLTDNEYLLGEFQAIVSESPIDGYSFHYSCSPSNRSLQTSAAIPSLNIKQDYGRVMEQFAVVISLHCKQIFPRPLVEGMRCVNIHPGLNPFNRGWYPQVFCILNKQPLGVTIHEMDYLVDHGPIIVQEEVPVFSWDTSETAYNRVLEKELNLIKRCLPDLVRGTYSARPSPHEGKINLRADFDSLRRIDLDQTVTYREAIDRLRALSHGHHRNAYFFTPSGEKVYIRVSLECETR